MQSGCFVRQGTKVGSTEKCGQIILTPRRVKQGSTQHSPAGLKSSSPVDSASSSPAKYGRLARAIFRGYPHQSLTGLSSANCNRKIIPSEVLSIPQRSSFYPPAEFIIKFPNRAYQRNPQRSLSFKSLAKHLFPTESFPAE